MNCPDTDFDCDNPGCRRGGCQGRRPELPLLRTQNPVLRGAGAEPDSAVAALSLRKTPASGAATAA